MLSYGSWLFENIAHLKLADQYLLSDVPRESHERHAARSCSRNRLFQPAFFRIPLSEILSLIYPPSIRKDERPLIRPASPAAHAENAMPNSSGPSAQNAAESVSWEEGVPCSNGARSRRNFSLSSP